MLSGLGQSSYPGLERWAVLMPRPRRRGMTISVRGNCCDVVEDSESPENIDARTRIASDGAKLLPYALVPTPDEYGLGGFERRLPRDDFACVALIELQAYVHLGKSSLFIRHCEAIASLAHRARGLKSLLHRSASRLFDTDSQRSYNYQTHVCASKTRVDCAQI